MIQGSPAEFVDFIHEANSKLQREILLAIQLTTGSETRAVNRLHAAKQFRFDLCLRRV